MKKKIILIILILLIIAVVITTILYINGKKKTSIILQFSKKMMELNSNLDNNFYLRQSEQEYGYFERYIFNGKGKIVTYYNETQIKYTDILDPSKTISYLEDYKNGKKLMCISPYEDESEDFSDDSQDEDSFSKLSEFFETINIGLTTKISATSIDGVDCYKITPEGDLEGTSTIYADKSTYLPYKIDINSDGKNITVFEYKYGVVTENDVKELNADEYELVSQEEFDSYNFSE